MSGGIPSHDTLNHAFNAIDPELFKTCFLDWVETLRDGEAEVIAIDGKTSRRSHDRSAGHEPLHRVSAWTIRERLVLGQEAVTEKSNEINAIPRLLKWLELTGALVTIDAMGTQAELANTIVRCGGDYLLALTGNRPAIHTDVVAFFADPPSGITIDMHVTVDGDHGRIEERSHSVCHAVQWLFSDSRYPDELVFPHLAALAMIENASSRRAGCASSGATTFPPRLSMQRPSQPPCARIGVSRTAFTGCSTSSSTMTSHACEPDMDPRNMAMEMIRPLKDKHSLKVRKKIAAIDENYMEALVRQAPSLT